MNIVKNIPVNGKHSKPILTDLVYVENNQPKQLVIFCHGYKGYKDWGAWNLVADKFANNNIFFVKMSFSHNGGTIEQPIDFPDLEAFGNNNFTIELDDIDSVLNWILKNPSIQNEIDPMRITLIGHSRGGGSVLIKASEDYRITKVITWAGISDFGSRFTNEEQINAWKKNGVVYVENGRTKQQMPHYFQFYLNYKENESRLNIQNAVKKLKIPYLIIHGSEDETVELKEAKNLLLWNSNNQLIVVENANHSFGSKHPWDSLSLPKDLDTVVKKSIIFIG
ncbi:MAG: alpha/beta hydrolase fold domain-containing protein [Flavobacteriaceae bacterium]|nr:alpha/beta hydrolase fold domain-containing protein [Flavobacteriaceae bacterium]